MKCQWKRWTSTRLQRLQKILLTISLLFIVAACTQPKLTSNTVIVHDPFPVMTKQQVDIMDSCLVMNSRNPKTSEDEKVQARLKCNNEFWNLDEWWVRFVKAWMASKN